MSAEKKFVYSVTLNEPVAAELRRLDARGKLSRGITRAQELLALPNVLEYALAVESNQVEAFYARIYSGLYKTAVRPPGMPSQPPVLRSQAPKTAEQAELDRIEQEAFAESEAAYRAGKPLPDHHHMMGKGLGHVRERVLERCKEAFGWRYGPVPPGIVLPTDNPFDDEPTPAQRAQEAPGDAAARSAEVTETPLHDEPPPDDTLSKAYRAIGEQSSEGPMDQGATAPAATSASTAAENVSGDPGRSTLEGLSEPQF